MNKPKPHEPEPFHPVSRRTLALIGAATLIALAALFIAGFSIRHHRVAARESMARDDRDRPLLVRVVQPQRAEKSFSVSLPADITAYASTALYARTDGYLASWTADIRDRVRQGDVLAVISAPDADADLEQAQAALRQQQTSYRLAEATDRRYQGLAATEGVTQEQLDQFHAAREQAGANMAAASATVDRMKALVGFEKIVAPFDGVITARHYDVGALVSAANTAPGQELFDLAEDDRLRVFVNVPQEYALLLQYGQAAQIALERNFPRHRFQGTLARSAGILDPATRTLRAELDVANDDPAGRILPGMYGEVILPLRRKTAVLTVPTSALLFEAEGSEVAIVAADNRIHFQKIVPGSDYGAEIEVLSGLRGTERVVSDPGGQLAEGLAVSPLPGAENPPPGTAGQ